MSGGNNRPTFRKDIWQLSYGYFNSQGTLIGIEGLTKSRPCGRIKDTRITNCRHLGEGIGPLPQAVRVIHLPSTADLHLHQLHYTCLKQI